MLISIFTDYSHGTMFLRTHGIHDIWNPNVTKPHLLRKVQDACGNNLIVFYNISHNTIRSYLHCLWHLTACEKMAEYIQTAYSFDPFIFKLGSEAKG